MYTTSNLSSLIISTSNILFIIFTSNFLEYVKASLDGSNPIPSHPLSLPTFKKIPGPDPISNILLELVNVYLSNKS